MPCGRWKIASVRRKRRLDSRREQGNQKIAGTSESRDCYRRTMAATGFLFILRGRLRGIGAGTRPIFSQLMSRAVHWETYAYCYLPRAGCVFLARNYTPRGSKGEIDLVGYDDKRWHLRNSGRAPSGRTCRPDLSVTREKQYVVVCTAQRFLEERHVGECSCRFDEMAIDNCPGQPPVVRLHKDAYSPQI